jgi:hypothetical protein
MKSNDPFHELFGEFTGVFSKGIHSDFGDLTELRESMQTFGWMSELPATIDENGVMLDGHRRCAVAKELGIKPVTRSIRFGNGPDADRKRLVEMYIMNIRRPFSANDKARLATFLYGNPTWLMRRVAEVLAAAKIS